jgi:hypothetical protein
MVYYGIYSAVAIVVENELIHTVVPVSPAAKERDCAAVPGDRIAEKERHPPKPSALAHSVPFYAAVGNPIVEHP